VDDVDVGQDGFCDCLRIGILWLPGVNPSANFQSWLTSQGTTVSRVHQSAEEIFDAALLSQFDVLLSDWLVRPYTPEEATILRGWVEQGGGYLALTGHTGEAAPDFYSNVFLAPYGLSFGGGLSLAPANQFFAHPITDGVSTVTFLGGYLVTSVPVEGGVSTLFAANADGHVGYAHERGKGRVIAWGDEWIEFDSEWTAIPDIKTFWSNMLRWVGPQNKCQILKP
jgi:hypothetical protein